MKDSNVLLAGPLLENESPRVRKNPASVALLSLVIFFGVAMVVLVVRSVPWTFGSGNQDVSVQEPSITLDKEMKIDPKDGVVYSFKDLSKKYKEEKSEDEIKKYWDKKCRPAKLLEGPLVEGGDPTDWRIGQYKIDPTDENAGKLIAYNYREFKKKHEEYFSEEEIKKYWNNQCKNITFMIRPTMEPPLRLRGAFFDQKGSRYQDDLKTLEDHRLVMPGAVVVADNVLKPGAPLFLWQLRYTKAYTTDFVSMKEFAMPAEDWMSVSIRRKDADHKESLFDSPQAPPDIMQMQWESDRIRDKATKGEGSVSYGEWAAFSHDFKQRFKMCGIIPTQTAEDYSTPAPPSK